MKRTLTTLLVPSLVAGLLASVVAVSGAPANAAQPPSDRARPAAESAVITGTVQEFIQRIPAVEPIKAGYKGTSSFLPPSVVNGKDKRGCNLRQRMLIDSAYVKPKVGRKCALLGGVWWVDNGTRKVTKSKDVAFTPMLTFADAWGQGASQWTPAQRLAWATQVERPGPAGPRTRAKAVTGQAATQQLISAAEAERFRGTVSVASGGALTVARLYSVFCERGFFTLSLLTAHPEYIPLCSFNRDFIAAVLSAEVDKNALCAAHASRLFNVMSWGLSLPPADLLFYNEVAPACTEYRSLQFAIQDAARSNQVIRIPSPQAVPGYLTDPRAPGAASAVIQLPFAGYSIEQTSGTITNQLFGVAAPVDWGDPGVPVGYLRLWDAGVSWRLMLPSATEPITWEKLDATMEMASRLGAKVMYVLGDTPGWANGGKDGAVPPTNLEDAAKFIGQVCSRYKATPIASFEAWNEGNLTTFWTGSMELLADLTGKVRSAVRDCGSVAKVYASSTGTRSSNAFVTNYPAYLKALAAKNWPVEGFTVHSYPAADGGPKQRAEELAQFKTLLALNGAPKLPILDTELNYGLAGLGQGRRVIDAATGAAYISQSFIQSVQFGVDSLFWFLWTQADYDKLGIQLNAGTPRTIQAWKQTREWLVKQEMTRCASGDVLQVCQITGPKGNATLLWTTAGEVNVNVDGLGTTVERLDGTSSPVGASKTVTVGVAPVAIRP
ncbi:MAG: hypothetical protein ACKOBJ_01170 [Actinomycetota bacterium]